MISLNVCFVLVFFSFISSKAFTPSRLFCSKYVTKSTRSLNRLYLADEFIYQSPESTRERISALVESHPVLLFMKGTQLFPQCGFSNTAVQILNTFNIDFHSVDVLADEAIRQGIKDYSQWPTIPQLYVAGEFIGGCDM
jgi:monothiol glutaredoxin